MWAEKKTFYQLTKEITSLKSQLTKSKNKTKESEDGKELKKSYEYGIKNDYNLGPSKNPHN